MSDQPLTEDEIKAFLDVLEYDLIVWPSMFPGHPSSIEEMLYKWIFVYPLSVDDKMPVSLALLRSKC